jgi:DNA-binding MarR family transcriptional regulator
MKTIKQIADALGIPKHKVKYQVEKLEKTTSDCVVRTGDIIHVTANGEAILQEMFMETSPNSSDFHQRESAEYAQQLIDTLTQELKIKNQQISELTTALTVAQQTVAAAQALHAGTMQRLTDSEQKPQSSFMSRIFGRNHRNSSEGVNE